MADEVSKDDASFNLLGQDVAPGRPEQVRPEPNPLSKAPEWVMPVVSKSIWRLIWAVIAAVVAYVLFTRARGVVSMVVISMFFGIAMDPAVTWLHQRRGWKRGAATGLIFLILAAFVIIMIFLLIPAIVTMASAIGEQLPTWLGQVQDTLGLEQEEAVNAEAAAQLADSLKEWVAQAGGQLLDIAGSTVGAVFNFFTIAMFTFYFAAYSPTIRRSVLTRFSPERQESLGWAWDTAIIQTGGYFYSRMLLVVINGSLFFFVMVLVGVDWQIALPLSVFEGFVAEFIPAVGTYIGAAVPIIVTLGLVGFIPALVLLGWTIIYQQLENYWLSPRLSSQTMELNGGVAFGAALAGGAMFGPMGAFMSLPAAAMITSFFKNYGPKYQLAYHSPYDDDDDDSDDDSNGPAPASS